MMGYKQIDDFIEHFMRDPSVDVRCVRFVGDGNLMLGRLLGIDISVDSVENIERTLHALIHEELSKAHGLLDGTNGYRFAEIRIFAFLGETLFLTSVDVVTDETEEDGFGVTI